MQSVKIFFAIVLMGMIGFGAGFGANQYRLEHIALAAKAAHYDTETGKFVFGAIVPQVAEADLFARAMPDESMPEPKPKKEKCNMVYSKKIGGLVEDCGRKK
jgi:hypothetical protein